MKNASTAAKPERRAPVRVGMSLPSRIGLPALFLLSAAVAGCGDNQDPSGADELWKRIHDEKYTSWERAAGYATKQPSSAPHGDEVVIYLNETIAAAVAGDPLTKWPVGSLIVKDGFSGDELDLVAAMEKRDDGWYWAEWSGDGSAKFSGNPDTCTSCHESGADFVRAFGFPK